MPAGQYNCFVCQDLSENDLGRETSCSLSIGDALRVNTGLRTLLLTRMTCTNHEITSAGRLYLNHEIDIYIRFNVAYAVSGVNNNCAFPVAEARTWTSLPPEVTSLRTLSTFKTKLKTYMFFSMISLFVTVKRLKYFLKSTIHLKFYVLQCNVM